jgi:hypothetical protein
VTLKLPVFEGSTEEAVRSWGHDMQDFQGEVIEGLGRLLGEHADAARLAAAASEYLAPCNAGNEDSLLVRAVGQGVEFENDGSGDGCTLVRVDDRWWLESSDLRDYGPPPEGMDASRQHEEAAAQAICFAWWGNEEDVRMYASAVLRGGSTG